MINFFKSNNPGVVICYVLYLVLFRICFFFIPLDTGFVFNHKEPLSQIFFGLFKSIPKAYPLLSLIASGVLCFIQALLINQMVNEHKVLPKKNYLAGLLFIIIFSFFKESLVLSPALVSLTFLILCTERVFSLIKKEKAFGDVFDLGSLIAIAALFYFPSVLFIIFAYIGLASVRPFAYREWINTLAGFLSPFVIVCTWYIWHNQTPLLLPDIINADGKGWLLGAAFNQLDILIIGELLLITLFSMALLPTALYSSLIQVRKYSTTLLFLILLIAISWFLQRSLNQSHWLLLALPLGIISAMVAMQIKNKLVAEVMHLILILLVLTGQYLPLLNLI